jgi:hypothetical protein
LEPNVGLFTSQEQRILASRSDANVHCQEDEESQVFDFQCAIVLYNFGLVHLLLASQAKQNLAQAAMQQSALRLHELAGQILAIMNQQRRYNSESFNEKILLGLLLMRGLSKIHEALNQSVPASCHGLRLRFAPIDEFRPTTLSLGIRKATQYCCSCIES